MINSQKQVGGWPALRTRPAPLDSDRDGMPDDWERERRLDPADPADGAREQGGYTHLEHYLHSLCPDPLNQ
jgi:hypothetical protein